MTLEEAKQTIREKVVISLERPPKTDLNIGIPKTKTVLVSEDLGLELKISSYTSNSRNKELAQNIFELVLSELIY